MCAACPCVSVMWRLSGIHDEYERYAAIRIRSAYIFCCKLSSAIFCSFQNIRRKHHSTFTRQRMFARASARVCVRLRHVESESNRTLDTFHCFYGHSNAMSHSYQSIKGHGPVLSLRISLRPLPFDGASVVWQLHSLWDSLASSSYQLGGSHYVI